MECANCHKDSDRLSEAGLCIDCGLKRRLEADLPIDVVAAVTDAADEDAVFTVLTENDPPRLDRLERARLRDKLVKATKGKLQSPAQVIDAWLSTPTTDDDGLQGMRFVPDSDPPWEEPVPGHAVLDETREAITSYAHMGEHEAVTSTLWTAWTHLHDCFGVCPNLQFWSPTWRCGKTSAAIPIKEMVRLGMFSSNITPAALFRAIDAWHPTLVIDEADTFVKMSDEIRGILNAGHTRATAYVIRAEGDNNEPRMFSSWAPKLIAGIGHLPNTVEDRSHRVRMSRKPVDVKTADAFDPDAVAARCHPIRRRLARWAADVEADVRQHEPERVPGVEHRDWNNWRPLLVVAELAGGDWPALARAAAKALSGADDVEEGLDELLFRHLRQVFGSEPALHTATIVERLVDLEEGPWAKWWAHAVKDGETKAAGAKLARMLKPFGVKSAQQWIDGVNRWGYARADLEPVWDQYARAATSTEDASHTSDARPQVDEGASDQDSSVRSVPSVPTEGSAGGMDPEGDGSPVDSNGHGNDRALELLRSGLGAVDSETLDYIDQLRRDGNDFSSITSTLRRVDCPPPPGRSSWDVASVVQAYGIRHP
jgi:putative DNA primase/helicase